MLGARVQVFNPCIEINNRSVLAQGLTVFRSQDGSPAGSKHDVFTQAEFLDQRDFAFAKTGFALQFKNQRDFNPGAVL